MEAAPHPWPTLGVLLMRDGIVSKEELEAILAEQHDARQQRISGRRLGEILIGRGVVTATQVAKLVAEQYELPFVDLDPADIDVGVARLLGEDLTRRFLAVPINARADGSYLLAIGDPATVLFSDELRHVLGSPPHFAVVGPEAIDAAIAYVYDRPQEPAAVQVAAQEDHLSGVVLELRPEETPATESYFGARSTATHLWPPLGALLIREGLLSDAELERALAQQRLSTSWRLGEILVARGVVTASAIARLVAEQYELPFVELSEVEIDPAAATLLPMDIAREFPAIPIAMHDDGLLEVAIADPTNVLYSNELHRALGVPLSFVVAAPDAIDAALEAVHAPTPMPDPEEHEGFVEVVDLAEPERVVDVQPSPALEAEASPDPVETVEIPDETDVSAEHEDLFEVVDLAEPERVVDVQPSPALEAEASPDPVETVEIPDETDVSAEHVEAAVAEPVPTWTSQLALDDVQTTTADLVVPEWEEPEALAADLPSVLLVETREAGRTTDIADDEDQGSLQEAAVGDDQRGGEVAEAEATMPSPEDHLEVVLEAAVDAGVQVESEGEADLEAEVPAEVQAEADAEAEFELELEVETEAGAPGPELHTELGASLERALRLGASAIHLSPRAEGYTVRARVDGLVRELGTVSSDDHEQLLERLESTRAMRVHVTPTKRGDKITLFPYEHSESRTALSELGLADDAADALHGALSRPSGAVVVCGPVGSGTTTTLYAALEVLNTPDRVTATIEDPVHHLVDGVDQLEVDRERGVPLAVGLHTLLGSDSDVVLVGDLPDRESAEVALRAAFAGRHVVAALHAPSAAVAIRRLAELGLEPSVLGGALNCVVAQRVVRSVCGDCRETYYASESELAELGRPVEGTGPRLLARGRGCDACDGTGFRGRVGIFEVLPVTDEIRSLICSGASAKKIERSAVAAGMRTLLEDGVRVCFEGLTTAAEIQRILGTDS